MKTKKNGLSLTIVIEAQSANYGEGFANIAQLKKMTRGNGEVYTYISRQALRFNIINQLRWDNTPVKDEGVVQFAPQAKIDEYPEIDLFGYMKTSSKTEKERGVQKIRSAVVRLSNAVSLEPYNSDLDFLTNMAMAKRVEGLDNDIAQNEIHKSMYSYTLTVDLDRVGIDENDGIEILASEKAKRIIDLLDAVNFLWRDIKGRRENLNPIFIAGGMYSRRNPYFEGRIELKKGSLNVGLLQDVINSCEDTKQNTYIGVVSGKFANAEEIASLKPMSIPEVFTKIKAEVADYYV